MSSLHKSCKAVSDTSFSRRSGLGLGLRLGLGLGLSLGLGPGPGPGTWVLSLGLGMLGLGLGSGAGSWSWAWALGSSLGFFYIIQVFSTILGCFSVRISGFRENIFPW